MIIENVKNPKVGKHTGEAGFEPSRPKATEAFIQHPQTTDKEQKNVFLHGRISAAIDHTVSHRERSMRSSVTPRCRLVAPHRHL